MLKFSFSILIRVSKLPTLSCLTMANDSAKNPSVKTLCSLVQAFILTFSVCIFSSPLLLAAFCPNHKFSRIKDGGTLRNSSPAWSWVYRVIGLVMKPICDILFDIIKKFTCFSLSTSVGTQFSYPYCSTDVLSGWVGEQIKCNWRKDEGCKCSWEGVSCKFQHKWGWRVSSITLASHNIGGHIPAAISDLQGLEVLNLAYNGLTGTLPPEFSSLTSLRTLYLHQNKDLTGTLPASYSELTELRNLNLGYCNFIGAVPEAWHNLPLITSLDISHNKLSGTLPVKWSNLKSLHMLSLNSNNQLIGPLPREWTSMVSHSNQELELNLYENMLLGNIPFAFNAVSDRITINFKPQVQLIAS